MMSSNGRLMAVLYAVFALGVFAITYFNPGPQLELALRMVVVTGAVFIAVNGILRRDPLVLVAAAGAGVLSFGLFTTQRVFFYIGTALLLGAILLATRKRNTTTPRPTGA